MAFFNEFPNTRTYDKDLGWLIHVVGQLQIEVKTFIENNTINIPDQITWDITKQYTRNTLVIDYDGTAYLSKQPVPIGIAITNTDYWMPIFNYDDSINTLRNNIAANERNNTTATAERHAGDLVWLGNALYKLTADMPAGTAYIVGTNVELYTVEDYLLFLKGAIASEAQARQDAVATLQGDIDAEVLARQGADNTLQGNIDAEVLARQGADNALQGSIDAITQNMESGARLIYLSPAGDDSNDGLTSLTPKRTIQSAIGVLKNQNATGNFVPEIHFAAGTYDGIVIKNMRLHFSADLNATVDISGELVLRDSAYLRIGTYLQDTANQSSWNIGGNSAINAIYIHGNSHLLTNDPITVHDCTNGIIADCGGQFTCHEFNTHITFGANVTNGIEASRSIAFIGKVSGSVSGTAYKSYGGILTLYEDTATAGTRLDCKDGGYFGYIDGNIDYSDVNLYVSTSGDDANSGLVSTEPLRTIQAAINRISLYRLNKNVTIHVAAGSYSGFLANRNTFELLNSGNVTFTSVCAIRKNSQVAFEGSGFFEFAASNDSGMFIAENSRVIYGTHMVFTNTGSVGTFVASGSTLSTQNSNNEINATRPATAVYAENSEASLGAIIGTNTTAIRSNGSLVMFATDTSTSGGTKYDRLNGGCIKTGAGVDA